MDDLDQVHRDVELHLHEPKHVRIRPVQQRANGLDHVCRNRPDCSQRIGMKPYLLTHPIEIPILHVYGQVMVRLAQEGTISMVHVNGMYRYIYSAKC